MKNKKKKGPDDRNRTDPKRKSELKRLFDSKKDELKSQQGQLLLKFLETYPSADAALQCCEMVWSFLTWLKEKGYHIIDGKTVFCFPFSKLVRLKDLK